MRSAVNEVCEGSEGGGETDDWAVEADNEDLGVSAEDVTDVQVECDKVLQPVATNVWIVLSRTCARYGHIGASVEIAVKPNVSYCTGEGRAR